MTNANLNTTIILTILFLIACEVKNNSSDYYKAFIDTTNSFKKEIPADPNIDLNIFYRLIKDKQQQLKLDNLEKGFENLQIRFWYDYALVSEKVLIIIKNIDSTWKASVYNYKVDWDGRKETVLSKKISSVKPKSGWEIFLKKLLDLKILTLPDEKDLTDYGGHTDGNSYHVEIATKNQYRFYGYGEPQHYKDRFTQAQSMSDILNLLQEELGVEQESEWFRSKIKNENQ